ncbi:MAG: DNA internalization-related competence protein ComEC/Rec2 [Candidatus Eisenbacteria bacterium]
MEFERGSRNANRTTTALVRRWSGARGVVLDLSLNALLLCAVAFTASARLERYASGALHVREHVETLSGVVMGFPQPSRRGASVLVSTLRGNGGRESLPAGSRVLVRVGSRASPALFPGDTLVATGLLRSPVSARNPGGFDEASYLFVRRIRGVLTVPGFLTPCAMRAEGRQGFLARYVAPVRAWLDGTIRRRVRGEERAFLSALLLGERGELSTGLATDFRESGLIHLLSVSGLHTALVGLIGFILLKGVHVPYRSSLVGSVLIVWFYCSLSGFQPPTVRASVMATCFLASRVLNRSSCLISPLLSSLTILLLANPLYLRDTGFQLSYVATASILLGSLTVEDARARLGRKGPLWRYVLSPGLVTLSAQLGILPILASQFGYVSLVSVPANLVAVPVSSAALTSAFCSLACEALFAPLGRVCFASTWLLLRSTALIADWVSRSPAAVASLARPSAAEGIVFVLSYFAFLGGAAAWLGRTGLASSPRASGQGRRSRSATILALCVTLVLLLRLCGATLPTEKPAREVVVDFLDVGQGDACAIRLSDGRVVLVDGGESSEEWDCAERVLLPYLRSTGRRSFDLAIVSHFHSDHAAGILRLIERRLVRGVVVADVDTMTFLSKSIRRLAGERNVSLQRVAGGDSLVGGGAKMFFLHPTGLACRDTSSASMNDSSLVFSLESGGCRILFTGDVGKEVMGVLGARLGRGAVTVLKVPHHGSRLGLCHEFMARVRPDFAVFSVGRNNRFGHPSSEVIESCGRIGCTALRTDRDGCVRVRLCRDCVRVSTGLSEAGPEALRRAKAWRKERSLGLLALVSRLSR